MDVKKNKDFQRPLNHKTNFSASVVLLNGSGVVVQQLSNCRRTARRSHVPPESAWVHSSLLPTVQNMHCEIANINKNCVSALARPWQPEKTKEKKKTDTIFFKKEGWISAVLTSRLSPGDVGGPKENKCIFSSCLSYIKRTPLGEWMESCSCTQVYPVARCTDRFRPKIN